MTICNKMSKIIIMLMLLLGISLTGCKKDEAPEQKKLKDGCKIITSKTILTFNYKPECRIYTDKNNWVVVSNEDYEKYKIGDTYCTTEKF
jgi:hypothetical protein